MSKIIEQAKKLKQILNSVDYSSTPQSVLDAPASIYPEWSTLIGKTITKGSIVIKGGIKYLAMQQVTVQAHQPPDMANGAMLAVYKPYRDAGRYPWLYGEYCLKDYEREYGGVWYRVTAADAGANIYSPNQVPAVWTKI